MADKYLYRDPTTGRITSREITVTSAGAGDAGKAVGLDGTGKLSLTVLPTGVGPDLVLAPASEDIDAGEFVNEWSDAGTLKIRLADGSNGREANGFSKDNITAPATVSVYPMGAINDAMTGLTVAADYWLSATVPGAATVTPPTPGANVISQYLGYASATTAMKTQDSEVIDIPV